MEKFKVKCIAIPNGKSIKTGKQKDVSMFFIGRELTVIDTDEENGQFYYTFEEEDVQGDSLLGDAWNAKYFQKL